MQSTAACVGFRTQLRAAGPNRHSRRKSDPLSAARDENAARRRRSRENLTRTVSAGRSRQIHGPPCYRPPSAKQARRDGSGSRRTSAAGSHPPRAARAAPLGSPQGRGLTRRAVVGCASAHPTRALMGVHPIPAVRGRHGRRTRGRGHPARSPTDWEACRQELDRVREGACEGMDKRDMRSRRTDGGRTNAAPLRGHTPSS
jgi:hypothetical protein